MLSIFQALICLLHVGDYLDLCCRVNADEDGKEKLAVEFLWTILCPFIHAAQHFLLRWPGLHAEVLLPIDIMM